MIIQKFGGIAMKDQEMRKKCIQHIQSGIRLHEKIVVVVSAMGRYGEPYATDSLLQITNAFQSNNAASDLVASCGELIAAGVLSAELTEAGIQNTVLHGEPAGIFTDGKFGDAKITHINPTQILSSLEINDCVILPGFQGIDQAGNTTTLGRGGSDLTAVAVASALRAYHVEFFKDVSGVMSQDPNGNGYYSKIEKLNMQQLITLLDSDRPIIQKRAVHYARKNAMPLYVRGIAGSESGTWILP